MIERLRPWGSFLQLPHVVLAVAVCACAESSRPPSRPPSVPEAALWAGGVDGGAWVACRYTTKEPFTGYDCSVFHHPSRQLWAEGTYALVRPSGNGRPPGVPEGPFAGGALGRVSAYDGESIFLDHDQRLVPHLEVSYPSDPTHGLRVQYRFGERLREEPY